MSTNNVSEPNEGIRRLGVIGFIVWLLLGVVLSLSIATSSLSGVTPELERLRQPSLGMLLAFVNFMIFLFGPGYATRVSGKITNCLVGLFFYYGAAAAASPWYPTYYEATIRWVVGASVVIAILLVRWAIDGFQVKPKTIASSATPRGVDEKPNDRENRDGGS
jgi:hypothetical protein